MSDMDGPLTAASTEALGSLCRQYAVSRLDLVGSAADGRFDPARSDLDFLVQFEPLHSRAYADAYFGLQEGLASLFRRPADLITEAALENPFLRDSIEAQRRRLYPR